MTLWQARYITPMTGTTLLRLVVGPTYHVAAQHATTKLRTLNRGRSRLDRFTLISVEAI